MGGTTLHNRELWALVRRQHGVVARAQLLDRGLSRRGIEHRIATGRLHRLRRGVYAVGRPELTPYGRWMAAVLSCGPEAVLSHESAAALWGIRPDPHRNARHPIDITIPARVMRSSEGVRVHRRAELPAEDLTVCKCIPVTSPPRTLIDLGARLPSSQLEAAVNEADKLDLIDPEGLRSVVAGRAGFDGVRLLRRVLDQRTFVLTDSELERRFLPLVRKAGLPPPRTGRQVNGFKVDFYWPELGLIVETDGLRYHRTPGQQARDRERDQAHAAAGLTPLRFTHGQIRFEPERVRTTLAAVARRLAKRFR